MLVATPATCATLLARIWGLSSDPLFALTHLVRMTRHLFLRGIGPRNHVIESHLVHKVFFFHLGSTDQNGIELFTVSVPQVYWGTHFAIVLLCRPPLLSRAGARRSRRRDSFDMSSPVAPPLEHATPRAHQNGYLQKSLIKRCG